MTFPIQIAAIGAGVLFALFLLFKDRNATRGRQLTYGGSASGGNGGNTYTYTPTYDTHPLHNRNNDNTEKECVICLSDLNSESEPTRKLRCGHIFHVHCISDWLKESRECPICRKYA